MRWLWALAIAQPAAPPLPPPLAPPRAASVELKPGANATSALGAGEWLTLRTPVPFPDASLLAWTLDVTDGEVDLLVHGGDAQPTLDVHQRAVLGVQAGSSRTVSIRPSADTPPCSAAACVVHAGVRGGPAGGSFALRVALDVDKRGVYLDLPLELAGSLDHAPGFFGAPLPFGAGLSAPVLLSAPEELCLPPGEAGNGSTGPLTGAIALVRRGTCSFVDKAMAAALGGALGVLVMNSQDGPLVRMGAPDGMSDSQAELVGRIPSVMISRADGDVLVEQLVAGVPSAATLAHADGGAPVRVDAARVPDATQFVLDAGYTAAYFAVHGLAGAREVQIDVTFQGAAIHPAALVLLAGPSGAEPPPSMSRALVRGEPPIEGGGAATLLLRVDRHPQLFAAASPPTLFAVLIAASLAEPRAASLRATARGQHALRPGDLEMSVIPADGSAVPYVLTVNAHLAKATVVLTAAFTGLTTAELRAALDAASLTSDEALWWAGQPLLSADPNTTLTVHLDLLPRPVRPLQLHVALSGVALAPYALHATVSYDSAPSYLCPPAASPGAVASPSPPPSPSPPSLPRCEYKFEPLAYGDEEPTPSSPSAVAVAALGASQLARGVREAHEVLLLVLVALALALAAERMVSLARTEHAPRAVPAGAFVTPALVGALSTLVLASGLLHRIVPWKREAAWRAAALVDMACVALALACLLALGVMAAWRRWAERRAHVRRARGPAGGARQRGATSRARFALRLAPEPFDLTIRRTSSSRGAAVRAEDGDAGDGAREQGPADAPSRLIGAARSETLRAQGQHRTAGGAREADTLPALADFELLGFGLRRVLPEAELQAAYEHAVAAELASRGPGSARLADLAAAHARLLTFACARTRSSTAPVVPQPARAAQLYQLRPTPSAPQSASAPTRAVPAALARGRGFLRTGNDG
ncbi:hypothetical protein KFE25_002003 [Diacronema lutheri]|uniref:PA domain-containing protein n=1 Tax=Diacronema lutheri TaxID=2081491 RepID=A0A8J5XQ39_DIALT|nr:hypothetical protein KFE25_002003 [Diacronema lutheri]